MAEPQTAANSTSSSASDPDSSMEKLTIACLVVIPLLILAILLGVLCVFLSRRRRRKGQVQPALQAKKSESWSTNMIVINEDSLAMYAKRDDPKPHRPETSELTEIGGVNPSV